MFGISSISTVSQSIQLAKQLVDSYARSSVQNTACVEDEQCTEELEGEIFVCKRPLQDVPEIVKQNFEPNHWSIAVHFPGFWCIIDGNCDEDGHLAPSYTKEFKFPREGTKLEHLSANSLFKISDPGVLFDPVSALISMSENVSFPEIKKVKISPVQFREIALTNQHSYKNYAVGTMDCQVWANAAARQLIKYKV